jgi:hypothetical protein
MIDADRLPHLYGCQSPSCLVKIKALSEEADRIPDLLREIEEYKDRVLHLSQMLEIARNNEATPC